MLDSCHSAAVTGPNFKPGPMGDRSFGQLSYDKGMLVLAATQRNNAAWGTLELGDRSLVAYALTEQQASAEPFNLTQWFSEAEKQVPQRFIKPEQQLTKGSCRCSTGPRFGSTSGPEQEVSIFDFSGKHLPKK